MTDGARNPAVAPEKHDGFQSFDVDIGSNRYYAWAVGSGATARDGVPMRDRAHSHVRR